MKHVVFTFMRCNPPTKGHAEVINMVLKEAEISGCDHKIVLTRTEDGNKNPLRGFQKLHYMQHFWPGVNFELADPTIPSIVHYIRHLAKTYTGITVIAGEDRLNEYVNLFEKYNGKEFYYRWWHVYSAGGSKSRDEISSTQMREWARDGHFIQFFFGSPKNSADDTTEVIKMYQDVRKHLK